MSNPGPQSHYEVPPYGTDLLFGRSYRAENETVDVVDHPIFNHFVQERRVKDMQHDIDELEVSWPETGGASNDPEEDEVAYGNMVQHHLLEVNKKTTMVLVEILEMLSVVQKRTRSTDERVRALEAEANKTPPPKTSCGFSCSNNSVSIE